jgi:ABC-type multidrug transport system fused ATPase/permease subunit
VLDEATSALDPVMEAEVLQRLHEELAGRAVLIVAHRLATVRRADRIAVLADGRVAEQGTHADLLARGGFYAQFYLAQVGKEAPGPGTPLYPEAEVTTQVRG